MGHLWVFRDQHKVRAPRAEDRRKTPWRGPIAPLTGPIGPAHRLVPPAFAHAISKVLGF
jgi:hypothetical protein